MTNLIKHIRSSSGNTQDVERRKRVNIFLVGGAVRDKLLGKTPKDSDYLVLNSSAEEMKKKGFIRVGNSYEVFLHPTTKEEYVLANDLEADLKRRDLTINSMAIGEDGEIIDPFLGREDLLNKTLRHTSTHFAEDPLRVYRVARFKAQFPDFAIAQETLELMFEIAKTSEFKNLHSNRIFNELKTALESDKPAYFFETLNIVGAMFPEIKSFDQIEQLKNKDSLLRFAKLVENLDSESVNKFCEHLGVPNEWREAGLTAALIYPYVDRLDELKAEELVELLYKMDAFRKSHLIRFLINLYGEKLEYLLKIFLHIKKVSLTEEGLSGKEIGMKIKESRVDLIRSFLEQERDVPHQ